MANQLINRSPYALGTINANITYCMLLLEYVNKSRVNMHTVYSGAPLMRTPFGPTQNVLIRGLSLFQGLFKIRKIHSGSHTVSALQWMSLVQGLFKIRKIRSGPHAVSALQWMSLVQGCLQDGVPL